MENLRRGVLTFRTQIFPQQRQLFERLATQQHPEALFITCADSRIVPELITQTGPGEIFVARNPGNFVPVYNAELPGGITASIEYANVALQVPRIIICGHTDCGALKALLHPEKATGMPAVMQWLRNGEEARREVVKHPADGNEKEQLQLLTRRNVLLQMEHLKTHPAVAARLERGDLTIHGWVYSIQTGEIHASSPRTGEFKLWPEEE